MTAEDDRKKAEANKTANKPTSGAGSARVGEPKDTPARRKEDEKTEDELAQEKADREEAAEREARAKIKAAESEGEVRNLAEKEADKLKLEGGAPIKSVAGKPSLAEVRDDGSIIGGPPDHNVSAGQGSPNASATNPALAANDAVPANTVADIDPAALAAAEAEGKTVVPLHGTGSQALAG